MNERIDEIAFEAGCHRHKYYDPKHPELEGYIINQSALDDFALRIIKECCGMVNAHMKHNNPHDSILTLKIKEHFGIE